VKTKNQPNFLQFHVGRVPDPPLGAPPGLSRASVSVTDPLNRFVTGLDGESFEVVENGTPRPITGFSDAWSPISIAIVSDEPLPLPDNIQSDPQVELIQTQSLPEHVQGVPSLGKEAQRLVRKPLSKILHGANAASRTVGPNQN
jgi:hypothetical protein